MKQTKNTRAILLVTVLTVFCMPLLLAMTGCAAQEEKKPSNYYTGPMQKRDAPATQKGPMQTE
jgi:hypothetical protein